jgi:hypothetical protein
MFRYTQACYQSHNESGMSEDYRRLAKVDRLNFNPEDYHGQT